MSTVGFGDFVPRSDFERAGSILMFLGANTIFSYVLSQLGKIIDSYDDLAAENEFGADLISFFALLKNFNEGLDISNK